MGRKWLCGWLPTDAAFAVWVVGEEGEGVPLLVNLEVDGEINCKDESAKELFAC